MYFLTVLEAEKSKIYARVPDESLQMTASFHGGRHGGIQEWVRENRQIHPYVRRVASWLLHYLSMQTRAS